MSTQYQSGKDVPTEVLAARLNELADVVARKRDRIGDEFTMRIPAECDRDADLVMSEAARRLSATPAVQGEPVAHTFYVLHDSTEGQKYIKKDIDDGCLTIFETEEDAQRAKRRHSGTDYKRVDYYTAPQPAEQQPDPTDAQILAITTAYEQGVGKGHDAHHQGEEIQNPYGTSFGCDKAWQMGYEEGKEQAAKPRPAPDVAGLVEALELLVILRGIIGGALWSLDDEDKDLAVRTDAAIAALAAYRKQGDGEE